MTANTSPLGQDTYKGLGVPLLGDSVVLQRDSSNAIWTLMHSTANAGRFMMFMDYKDYESDPSTLLTDLVVADIDADGGFRSVSGTTVKTEMNSSGLFGNGVQVMNSSLEVTYRQPIVTITTNGSVTANSLVSTNAGKLHWVSTQLGSTVLISITTVATKTAGMWWDIFSNTSAAGVLNVAIVGANKSTMAVHHGSTNAVVTTVGIENGTSGPFWVRIMVASTLGDGLLTAHNFMGTNGSTSISYFTFAEGTSAHS